MKFLLTLIILLSSIGVLHADVYVLCYHSFLGRENVSYDFSLEELKSHLVFLKDRGFKFITIDDLTGGRVRGQRNILVTIDDGNHSVYDAYYKVFKPMGIKPLLGIYTFILGHRDYALTWDKLKKLSDDGCDIASHGFFHLKLNDKLYREQKKQFIQEIAKSKTILEEKLNRKITSFVYPFGLHSASAVEILKNSGYKYAFTIVNNAVRTPITSNRDPYRLPRYMLTRSLYQGSLNTIARLAEKQEKTALSAIPSRGDTSAKVAGSGETKGKTSKTEKKPLRKASVRMDAEKTKKDDIRYGAVYAEVNKDRKIKKKKERPLQIKKHNTAKTISKTASAPPPDKTLYHIQLSGKKNEYDLAYLHNISNPRKQGLSADGSSEARNADTSSLEKTSPPPRRPGRIKERWNDLSAGIIEFYTNFIEIKIRKASRFIQAILGYIGRSAAFHTLRNDVFFNS